MLTFSFSYHKITLFENKYGIKLITLIFMYQLKPLVSLQVQSKLKCRFVYFEDTVTCFDKIVMFFHRGKQIDILKFIQL